MASHLQAFCLPHLSLGLVSFLVCNSFWQIFHDSDISSILGSLMQCRLHFNSFMEWTLKVFTQGLPCHTLPDLSGALKLQRKKYTGTLKLQRKNKQPRIFCLFVLFCMPLRPAPRRLHC